MIEDLSKHLTDQEFFTYVKFFDMVVSKNNLADEDLNEINVYKFSIGEAETYYANEFKNNLGFEFG